MKTCDECGMRQANIHLTQIMHNETQVFHLCDECARKKGVSISMEDGITDGEVPKIEEEKQCRSCRLKLSEFRSRGWLGCCDCFSAFEKEIDELLIQVHGSSVHKGKKYSGVPQDCSVRLNDIERLRSELNAAIRNEEFEHAAALRDAIHSLKQMGVK